MNLNCLKGRDRAFRLLIFHDFAGNEEEASKIEEGDEAGEGEEEEGEDADDDMQLAWENLEVAKSIYERNTEANKSKLAGKLTKHFFWK